jgi:hypothetical protein
MGASKLAQRLWKCNDAPTDDEQTQLQSEILNLKAEFHHTTSTPFTLTLPTHIHGDTPSKKVRKLHQTILQHLGLLSCIRTIPAEIWQNVFSFALADTENQHPDNPHDRTLRTLCHVCALWSATARGQQSLWAKLPTFEFGHLAHRPGSLKHPGRTIGRLEQYLANSGTRPFTFGFVFHHDRRLIAAYLSFPHTVLKRLVQESHRWEGALLYLARYSDGGRWPADLARIKGRLPVLSRLDLTVAARDDAQWSAISSLFFDAPKLRHVVFNSPRYLPRGVGRGSFNLALPWGQLETFEGVCHQNLSVIQLLTHCQDTLTTLKCDTRPHPGIPPPVVTLHKLTTLSITFSFPTVTTWLTGLTLPALRDLELHGDEYGDIVPLSTFLQHLLHRSQSLLLRRFVLGIRMSGPERSSSETLNLRGLLSQCPLLAELEIPSSYAFDPRSGVWLSLDVPFTPGIADKIIPRLKVLTLRSDARDSDWAVDPEELLRMFSWRTLSTQERTVGGLERLREVRFVHSGPGYAPSRWCSQLDLLDRSPSSAFNVGERMDPAVVELWKEGLGKLCRVSYSASDFLNILHQREMNTFMKVIEEYDLSGCDSRILVVSPVSSQLVRWCMGGS